MKIWATYSTKLHCLSTCFPPDVEDSVSSLIEICFRKNIRPTVRMIYKQYLLEHEKMLTYSFETKKAAARFYFENTIFYTLHSQFYSEGQVKPFSVINLFRKIITGDSKNITIAAIKKNKKINYESIKCN